MVKERLQTETPAASAGRSGRSGAVRRDDGRQEQQAREKATKAFGFVEDGFYLAVAVALGIAGIILFGYTVYNFVNQLGDASLSDNILELLDGMLLVFIFTELIHTVRAVIEEKVLVAEPFLIVGIVAGIRRLIVVSAEAKDLLGTPDFTHAILEMGVLAVAIIFLTLSIFLLRNTSHSEPRSAHEPGDEIDGRQATGEELQKGGK
jgi:uncharacterized membrane protein (DUF373 family)